MPDKPDYNIQFNDGTPFYVKPDADPEAVRRILPQEAEKHGGFSSIDIEEYQDLMPEGEQRKVTMPRMPNIFGAENPFLLARGYGKFGGFTQEVSPLQASNMIDVPLEMAMEEVGSIGLPAAVTALTKKPPSPKKMAALSAAGAGSMNALSKDAGNLLKSALDLPTQDVTWGDRGGGFAQGSLAELTGRAITSGIPYAWRAFRRGGVPAEESAARLDLVRSIGIERPDIGMITGSPFWEGAQNWMRGNPITAGKMKKEAQDNTEKVIDNLRLRLKTKGEPVITGRQVELGIKAPGWKTKAETMYSAARKKLIRPDATTPLDNLTGSITALGDNVDELLNAPSLPADAKRMIKYITEPKVQALSGAPMPVTPARDVESIRKLRTEIRKSRGDVPRGTSEGANTRYKQYTEIYDALTKDLENAYLEAGGKKALASFRKADKYWATNIGIEERYLKDISRQLGHGSTAEMYKKVANDIAGNEIDTIAALRTRVDGDQWAAVTDQYIFDRVLTHADGLKPEAFTQMWNEMSPLMKKQVFGGDYNHWAKVNEFFEDFTSHLKTANEVTKRGTPADVYGPAYPIIAGSGAVGAGAAFGTGVGAMVGLGLIAIPPVAARLLLKNNRFVDRLVRTVDEPIKSFGGHAARFAALAGTMDEDEQRALALWFAAMSESMEVPEDGRGSALAGNSVLAGMGGF